MLRLPFNGIFKISQGFGQNYNNFYRQSGMKGHSGVDIAMPNGTPILAPCDGEVIFTTDPEHSARTGYGVSIKSDEIFKYKGEDCKLSCLFAHLKEGTIKVKRGDKVKTGDLLALSNNTGQSTGPHLHLGIAPLSVQTGLELVKDNGYKGYVNPLLYLPNAKKVVKELQAVLNMYGWDLVEDGIFGKLTAAAYSSQLQVERH